jgi:YHS domain-containing protein
MKPKVVQCEYCKTDVSSEPCKLASIKTVIDGKEYVFCCLSCAQQSKESMTNGK